MKSENSLQPFEIDLTVGQSEVLASRLPPGYSFSEINNLQRREHRILIKIKKVQKYDATLKDSDSNIPSKRQKQQSKPRQDDSYSKPPVNLSEELKLCYSVFKKFKNHPKFNEFYSIVQQNSSEIDILRIEASFRERFFLLGNYTCGKFLNDIKRLVDASYALNPKDSQGYLITTVLDNYFNEIFKVISNQKKSEESKKKKQIKQQNKIKDVPMTYQEKKILGENIRSLPTESLRGVWEIVQEGVHVDYGEELEFDIDQLPSKVARKLERYVNSILSKKTLKKIKSDQTSHLKKNSIDKMERNHNRNEEQDDQIDQEEADDEDDEENSNQVLLMENE